MIQSIRHGKCNVVADSSAFDIAKPVLRNSHVIDTLVLACFADPCAWSTWIRGKSAGRHTSSLSRSSWKRGPWVPCFSGCLLPTAVEVKLPSVKLASNSQISGKRGQIMFKAVLRCANPPLADLIVCVCVVLKCMCYKKVHSANGCVGLEKQRPVAAWQHIDKIAILQELVCCDSDFNTALASIR